MGLRYSIQSDIAAAFDTDLSDAVQSFTATRTAQGAYDPATGTVSEQVTTYTGRGVFGAFKVSEADGQNILATDVKLTALQNELTDTPKINDVIDSKAVVSINQDPAGATYTLALRKT